MKKEYEEKIRQKDGEITDLKNKMASSGACSTVSGIPTSSLAAR